MKIFELLQLNPLLSSLSRALSCLYRPDTLYKICFTAIKVRSAHLKNVGFSSA